MSRKVLWYKNIVLYNITCPVIISITKKTEIIMKMIMQVCQYYGEITSKKLSDTFGLQESIVEKLLSFLANNTSLLNVKIKKGIYHYSLIKQMIPLSLESKQVTLTIVINFSLCLNPLLFVNNQFKIEEVQESNNLEDISNAILKLNEVLSSGGKLARSYNIPKDYLSFNIQEGIRVNGQSHALLNWDDNNFILTKNRYEIKRISDTHQEISKLKKELEELQTDDTLFDKILLKLQEEIDDEEFDFNLDKDCGILRVKLLENNLQYIGRIYQIFSEYNGKIVNIPMENEWFYAISIKIDVDDPIMSAWIYILTNLENELRTNFQMLANKDINIYVERILMLFDSSKKVLRISLSPSENDIRQIIENVCMVTDNGWLHLINGKINESEVVE